MYIGRFLVVAPNFAAYRVSSRSFPHRKIIKHADNLTVTPTPEAPPTDNPYISYNCLQVNDSTAIIGNGSHVDPIAEKLEMGYPARDALAMSLLSMDYEKDEYSTPRIAGILGPNAYIGIVRPDALIIKSVSEPTLIATYQEVHPTPFDITPGETPDETARRVLRLDYGHPVCAGAVHQSQEEFEMGYINQTDM
jgi:IMP cyclohydrolase